MYALIHPLEVMLHELSCRRDTLTPDETVMGGRLAAANTLIATAAWVLSGNKNDMTRFMYEEHFRSAMAAAAPAGASRWDQVPSDDDDMSPLERLGAKYAAEPPRRAASATEPETETAKTKTKKTAKTKTKKTAKTKKEKKR